MICISDISGNITTVLPESLHQGSRGVNKIVLLAPFPSNATVSVFLTLPNGMSLYPVLANGADPDPYIMASVDVALGIQKDGVDLNAWAYTMNAPVTEYSGTLTIQFSITMTDGQLTTSAVNLPISRGVPTLSPTVTKEDLDTIEAYLAAAQVAATAAEQSAEDADIARQDAENSASEAKQDFTTIQDQVNANSKRIESLESFNLFSTVFSRADVAVVPARSAKYAMINILSSNVTAVKSYGANLLDSSNFYTANKNLSGDNTFTNNNVTFKRNDDDGSFQLTTSGTISATASAYIVNKAQMLGDSDYITVSIYGSTEGTRLRAYTYNADGTQAEVVTLDDNTRSATLRRLPEAGATITIIFNISAGATVNGTAYIMVVNGDRPVPYYQYTETAINTYTFPKSITTLDDFYNKLWYVNFNEGMIYNTDGGDLVPIEFAAGSNSIKVQGAGRLVFEHADGKVASYSITYQEGNYVFE